MRRLSAASHASCFGAPLCAPRAPFSDFDKSRRTTLRRSVSAQMEECGPGRRRWSAIRICYALVMPPENEDEFTFAQRRVHEGAKRAVVVAELRARGVDADLAETMVNGAMANRPRGGASRFGWLELTSGVLLLIAGAALFVVRVTQMFDGVDGGFAAPGAILVFGGLLLARGLFR